jgi:hypothetical protein
MEAAAKILLEVALTPGRAPRLSDSSAPGNEIHPFG